MELVCPAGSLPALKAAVDNGADAVYIGFRDDTNARHFAGLNFNEKKAHSALDYARRHGVKVLVAINTYPRPDGWQRWQAAVDMAAGLDAHAVIAADPGVLAYIRDSHPQVRRHLSVQASATNLDALKFYHERFGVSRVVIPRVLSMAQVAALAEHSPVELEVFAFGSLCIMAEGRCWLSSYLTSESPNTVGACSPAKYVRWEEHAGHRDTRLNGVLIDRFREGENAGYPTLCKGRYQVGNNTFHALEEPTSLNTLSMIPELVKAGVSAVKIEGRQRSPAYTAEVTRVWREALDRYSRDPEGFAAQDNWNQALAGLSEGCQTTLGAYHRSWQ
ncbi:ubiquinone anaerobic biosynthesis protein UbiU [Parendozoicomonas haliclonae]|uniref:Ubiquinone biosynthesis protein UbiU n=1 Tax=Parendozoicomonas haliclonae TaxID=1960125 RepID=A0A1X7AME6_9GAMM|nr:peptidase U32 family protein [Parendozoicomonas haliclonae]SMA49438.1 putative protease YhbU precursor [Parendozoicomonas haliclonae]